MRTHPRKRACAVLALALATVLPRVSLAQEQPTPKPATPVGVSPGPMTPLRVQLVFSRYAAGKKVSNLPFVLTVNANDGRLYTNGGYQPFAVARLRTGAEVQVSTSTPLEPRPDGTAALPNVTTGFRNVGTDIDCYANSTGDGRYRVDISIEDRSLYPAGQGVDSATAAKDAPVFRTFSSKNTLMLKIGQPVEFSAWADRISGEETRITVTVQLVQ